MVKNVLCYGDSLTWGYDADTIGRHAFEDRWPSVLQQTLGDQARILLHPPGDLVEQLAQGHEMRPLDVPVGLPTLQLQIDGVGQAAVQDLYQFGLLFLRQDRIFPGHGSAPSTQAWCVR